MAQGEAMTDLSPDLKKLVNIAHDAMSPSEQQVNAVRDALKARLGETPGPQGGGPGAGGATALGAWSALQIVGIACVALGVIAGAVVLWGRAGNADVGPVREQTSVVVPPPVAAAEVVVAPRDVPRAEARPVVVEHAQKRVRGRRERGTGHAAPVVKAAPSPITATTNTATSTTTTTTTAPATALETTSDVNAVGLKAAEDDALALEVDLLARARAALTHGQPALALALAEQHASRFPHGTLRQEQLATRMRALCALGRSDDARSVMRELEQTSRRSPHLMSVDAHCLREVAAREVP
jgi:hypothetical protein